MLVIYNDNTPVAEDADDRIIVEFVKFFKNEYDVENVSHALGAIQRYLGSRATIVDVLARFNALEKK